jgi:hypothetical protein
MRPPSAANNEFADAASRMFAKRANAPRDSLSEFSISPDSATEWEEPSSSSTLRPGSALFRALLLAPFVVVGFLVVWYLRPEQPQPVPPKPPAVERVAEVKPKAREPVDVPRTPPPPVRREAVELKPPASPPQTATVAAPPPEQEIPSAPLSKDEIKELQGKLGQVGFGPGPIDGVVGPQTQAALRRYAEARRLANADATRDVLSRLKAESSARQ